MFGVDKTLVINYYSETHHTFYLFYLSYFFFIYQLIVVARNLREILCFLGLMALPHYYPFLLRRIFTELISLLLFSFVHTPLCSHFNGFTKSLSLSLTHTHVHIHPICGLHTHSFAHLRTRFLLFCFEDFI